MQECHEKWGGGGQWNFDLTLRETLHPWANFLCIFWLLSDLTKKVISEVIFIFGGIMKILANDFGWKSGGVMAPSLPVPTLIKYWPRSKFVMLNRKISLIAIRWCLPLSSTMLHLKRQGVAAHPLHWGKWQNTENGQRLTKICTAEPGSTKSLYQY